MPEIMAVVRRLTQNDLTAAVQLSESAGWNQTPQDWRRLLELEPDGCFDIDAEGSLAATATLLCHDERLAWLGMVLTRPDCRRRGYAGRLVETALDFADQHRIATVKLDASDVGHSLYLARGFEDEQPVERWRRDPGPMEYPEIELHPGPPDLELDKLAFGANRSRFLAALGPAWRFHSGYLMHRAGRQARHLGPCVARDAREAASAIRAAIATHADEPWLWDLPPGNGKAVEIARSLGFVPVRRLTRMRRGAPVLTDDNLVYALSGFEAG